LTVSITQESGGAVKESLLDLSESVNTKLYWKKFSGSIGSLKAQGGMQVYNSNGEMTEWYIGGKKTTFSYATEGRVIESSQWSNNKVEFRKRYKYKEDKYGNWIEQYEYNNFPFNNDQDIDPNEWYEGKTNYREINYYE
jgi:hypothetical protein